jgi:hypothetical protein
MKVKKVDHLGIAVKNLGEQKVKTGTINAGSGLAQEVKAKNIPLIGEKPRPRGPK